MSWTHVTYFNFFMKYFDCTTKMPQGRGEKTDNEGGNSGHPSGKGRKWGLAGWKKGTLNRSGILAGQSCNVGCLIFHALCSCLRRHGEDDAEVEKTAFLGIGSENHVGAVFQFELPGGAQSAKGFYLDGFRELDIDNASHVYPRVDEFVDGIGKYLRVVPVVDVEVAPVGFYANAEAEFFLLAKPVLVVHERGQQHVDEVPVVKIAQL